EHAARLVQRPTLTARRPGRRAGRARKPSLRSNKKSDEGQKICCLANSLTTKAPYKGLGADSEEKHEPVSDIDTGVVDSLKVLDPKRPIREADITQGTRTLHGCSAAPIVRTEMQRSRRARRSHPEHPR